MPVASFSVQQAGTNNPLIMLDEMIRWAADFRGDRVALLEVLTERT